MMGLSCRCNTAGGVKGPEGRPWSCPGFGQTCGLSPLAKLSTGQQLPWQFWEFLPEQTDLKKILKKHRCDSNRGLVWFCVCWREQKCVGRSHLGSANTAPTPVRHQPSPSERGAGTWEAHSSFQTLQTPFSSWFYAPSFLPLSLSSSLKAGRESSWRLAARDQSHPPTHYNHHAIRLF